MSSEQDKNSTQTTLSIARSLLKAGKFQHAISHCESACQDSNSSLALELLLNQCYQANSQFDRMLQHAKSLANKNQSEIVIQIRLVECLIFSGDMEQAISLLKQLAKQANSNHQLLTKLAELFLHASQFESVRECHTKALQLSPMNTQYQYNLATSQLFFGNIELAETLLKQVISNYPNDHDAYYALSGLKKQTEQNNNISLIKQSLANNKHRSEAIISLGYSLAKEYEDLGEYNESFEYLQNAASTRRQQLSYQVTTDVNAIEKIKEVFNPQALNETYQSKSEQSPIFILGLPRSGTTLVERILSGHSQVASLGEINNLAFSIIHGVGPHNGKLDLIERSINCNMQQLADRYTKAVRGYGVDSQYLIDKTPLNFLYIGLIKKAFPNAKIIHLQRSAMDSCYAMYKTLFRMGYPFSYDLNDLGQYYISYHQLMQHWREVFANGFYDLDYKDLVEQPEPTIKKLLEYCELGWEPQLLDFSHNKTASATASAAQVRSSIYTSSVSRWRSYSEQLAPLVKQLAAAGINID